MRTAQSYFDEYGESHQNGTNKLIHWLCVPVIFYCVFGLVYCIPPLPIAYEHLGDFARWDILISAAGLVFYLRLSISLFIGFLIYVIANLYLIRLLDASVENVLYWFIGLFVAAWIGQFIGHNIEGKKPSFLKDVQFLMIGPAWLMSFIYSKLGLKY